MQDKHYCIGGMKRQNNRRLRGYTDIVTAAVADPKLAVIEIGGWPMRVNQVAAAEFKPPTPPPPLVRPTSEEAVLITVDHDDSSGRCFWWHETHRSRADEGCTC